MRTRTQVSTFIAVGTALLACVGCGGSATTNSSIPPPPVTIHNQWTWESGANIAAQPGVYGTQGIAAATNLPGAREQAISWTDASGTLWLFGGNGLDATGLNGYLGDVWKYGAGQWTWVSGANTILQPPAYGTLGATSSSSSPGARNSEVHWLDASGDLWLFGGGSDNPLGTVNFLNDLWKYSAGAWTWEEGSNLANQPGVYGTQGTAAPANMPGGRFHAVSWLDPSGNFWLFGGEAYDINGDRGYLNDLWKYSGGQWTWAGGSNVANTPGLYGTLGSAAANNIPGGRAQSVSWTDASGNFWLFGGDGFDAAGNYGYLSDLWKYSAGQWTWMAGPNLCNQPAIYGTQGTAAAGNTPGARNSGVGWIDASGALWLFGGGGYNATVNVVALNDLWKYSAGEWTWVSGSNTNNAPGTYGTQGTTSAGNAPGGRFHSISWTDASGNFWLFGGNSIAPTGTKVYLNDLWKYQP